MDSKHLLKEASPFHSRSKGWDASSKMRTIFTYDLYEQGFPPLNCCFVHMLMDMGLIKIYIMINRFKKKMCDGPSFEGG